MAALSDAARIARKLRSMGAGELTRRVGRWAYTTYERPVAIHRARQPSRPAVVNHDHARWQPGPFLGLGPERAATRDALLARYEDDLPHIIERADAVVAGHVELFGTVYHYGPDIDWHRDPPSGWRWPSRYHGDIFRESPPPQVDVKHVWELNRHQFVVDLGIAGLVTGQPTYVDAIDRIISTWRAQNPVAIGVNWAGPLEVAYRALSWLWALHLVWSDETGRRSVQLEWLDGLQEHGAFLYRHLECDSSPYNHLIGEASVLWMLGVTLPHVPEASRWRERAQGVLEQRLDAQFYPDGGSVEQAVVYHHATLSYYLLAALVGRQSGVPLSARVWSAIERALDWAMHMTQPNGHQPAIGDNDDARPIRFTTTDTWDFRPLLSLGAVLFQRPDFKQVAGRLHQEALWLVGPTAADQFDRIAAATPTASTVLASSGYVILRSDQHKDYVCFDVGPQAGGLRTDDLPSAAHGHADALAVIVHLDGQPLFVDAGFLTYNGDPVWERFFRQTIAHNTITVDHHSQARYHGKMTWSHVPRVSLEGCEVRATPMWARGSHDGYCRRGWNVHHRRTVVLPGPGTVVIIDELEGASDHEFELGYTCAPGRRATTTPDGFLVDDCQVVVCASPALRLAVERGEQLGWVAPQLDKRVAADRLRAVGRTSTRLTTVVTMVTAPPRRPEEILATTTAWPDFIDDSIQRVMTPATRGGGRAEEHAR